MRFVTFSDGRDERVGVLCDGRVTPLGDSSGDLVDLIVAGDTALDFTRAKLAVSRDKGVPLADVRLLAPLRRFGRAEQPTLGYEAGLAVVIGRSGRSIPPDVALNHVWGYTLANGIGATMAAGPCVVTPDELGDPQDLRLHCLVNGEVREDAYQETVFDVATLISELSSGTTLRPGDLLLTGSPQIVLADGDEVLVRCERIGELRNRVSHSDLATPSMGERP